MITRRAVIRAAGLAAVVSPLRGARAQDGATSLADLRRQGFMRIATTGANAPYTFVDQGNQLVGFDIDWSRAICAGLGVEPRFSKLDWRGILPGLIAGQFDGVMSAVRVTPEREAAFAVSGPYGTDDIVVMVPAANAAVREVEDLKGLTIGAATGSLQEQAARELAPGATLRSYPGLPDLILEMRSGRLDAAVVGRGGAAYAIRVTNAPLKLVGRALKPGPLGMVLRKGSTELAAAVTAVIAARKDDGQADAIARRWFGA